ncbi:MAG: hypothetical protein AAF432_08375 [Planctomycetota bacterium]
MIQRVVGYGFTAFLAVCGAGFLFGCAKPIAAAQGRLTAEDDPYVAELSAQDQAQVIDTLQLVGTQADRSTRSASRAAFDRGRWSDVPAAVRIACLENEMAIFTRRDGDDVYAFTIRTVDDRPGTIRVEQRPAPDVYAVEVDFPSLSNREQRTRNLIADIERHMRAFGRKRQLVNDPY